MLSFLFLFTKQSKELAGMRSDDRILPSKPLRIAEFGYCIGVEHLRRTPAIRLADFGAEPVQVGS